MSVPRRSVRRACPLVLAIAAAAALAAPSGQETGRDDPDPSERSAPDACTRRLIDAALERTRRTERYDGRYRKIPYPGGDVPDDVGVCTDLIVRAYRAIGTDLQKEVHEDMSKAFDEYPKRWGLDRPDPNIDHRRVLNLRVFFRRRGGALPVSRDPAAYRPGDLVTWTLPSGLPHIGLVTDRRSGDGERPLIVHNIGAGPILEDMLFKFPITGHYRYRGNPPCPS